MMESAENIKMFCCQVIPIYKSRCLPLLAWFSAYAESIDDITMLNAALSCGPKPTFRSGLRKFVPDRQNLYHKLGFETLKYNAVAAQMSRGKSENPGFCHE
jgi:hypothetical protein